MDLLLRDALQTLETAAEKEHVLVAPVCYFGYGSVSVRPSPRYQAYVPIIGKENDNLSNTITGIHLHLDQVSDKLVEQQRILTALDPLGIALTSSSPIDYSRRNGLNCHRTHLVKNIIFADSDLHCASYYAEDEQDMAEHDQQRYNQWRARWIKNTGKTFEEFQERFASQQNTGYHSPRKRDNIGNGTWEVRVFDTTPRHYALAAVALYKGIHDRMVEENIPVAIAAEENEYLFTGEKIILPTLSTLQALTNEAIKSGLHQNAVADYLHQALSFAEEGLSSEDRSYLLPAASMLQGNRMNFADRITAHLPYDKEKFDEREIAQANHFVREEYRKTI